MTLQTMTSEGGDSVWRLCLLFLWFVGVLCA